jgi:His-Xaa-Ser system protein HxsD
MKIRIKKDQIEIKVQLKIYNLNILHKCFYWYSNEFEIDIEVDDQDKEKGIIKLYAKNDGISNDKLKTISQLIRTDLIDFKTRDIITKETKSIRDLLIAKAFSNSDEFDQEPPGDI